MVKRQSCLQVLGLIVLIIRTTKLQGTSCDVDSVAGPDNPVEYTEDLDKDQGFGYVVYKDPFIINCCGTVLNWTFSIGDNGDIELQVWRPAGTSNSQFELVGFNDFTVLRRDRKIGFVSFEVDADDVISVQQGDVIGWYAPGDSLVEYKTGTSYDGIWKLQHDDSVTAGTVVDFSSGMKQLDRTYGIQAQLAPNNLPDFDLPLTTSVRFDAEVGSTVYVIPSKDDDPGDVASLQVQMTSQNEFFAFDSSTNVLSVAKELTALESGQTLDLDFKVTDRCGGEGFGTLRVTVGAVDESTTSDKNKPDKKTKPTTTSTTYVTFEKTKPGKKDKDDDGPEAELQTEDEKSPGAMIGGVVVAIVIVIIVVMIILYIVHKRTRTKTSPVKDVEKDDPSGDSKTDTQSKDTTEGNVDSDDKTLKAVD